MQNVIVCLDDPTVIMGVIDCEGEHTVPMWATNPCFQWPIFSPFEEQHHFHRILWDNIMAKTPEWRHALGEETVSMKLLEQQAQLSMAGAHDFNCVDIEPLPGIIYLCINFVCNVLMHIPQVLTQEGHSTSDILLLLSNEIACSAAEALLREKCLGVSMVYAPGSEMEYLAVATPQEVVIFLLSDNNITFPNDESLCTLMLVKKSALAGFHMPWLSIQIYYYLNKIDAFFVDNLWNDKLDKSLGENIRKVCLCMWISAVIISKNTSTVVLIKPIETQWLKREVLECLDHLLSQANILEHAKPTEISNDFTEVNKDSSGQLQLYNSRFRTRLSILLTTSDSHKFKGSPTNIHGKQTNINVSGPFHGKVTSVKVFGRERVTNTEKAHNMLLLRTLQGECHIRQSKFMRMLWFPSNEDKKDLVASSAQTSSIFVGKLNESQWEVVLAMISTWPLVLAHGPPGTGKTSTISAAAEIWGQSSLPTWIIAHSNVTMKNIAEKLALYDVDFKIIMSKEFYVKCTSSIILSMLSMVSNSTLDQNGMFDLVPPTTLVVDEASQINVFEYIAIPPYGKEKAPSMQCIFDIGHLKDIGHRLDIQYLPHRSYAFHLNDVMDLSCITFIDAKYGNEEKSGFSWWNNNEVQTVTQLVQHYYQGHDFCIITLYNTQRAAIEEELKSQNLPWEWWVFNIDSFQAPRTLGPGNLTATWDFGLLGPAPNPAFY
ncbi:P-loop containing nucleoside triphosphate hydrolase protein [Armillaria nabsnona]|nr:P-loop containing nucleoside triphosphate hydrolase protein [Armillaria nabsnona]